MTEEEKQLSALKDLFLSPGWEVLKEKLKETESFVDDVRSLTTLEELYFAKGQLEWQDQLLSLESAVDERLKELQDPSYVPEAAYSPEPEGY